MTSQPERIGKIRALLNSPVEGERAAARAALERVDTRPERGSIEWLAAVREWNRKIEFCIARLGTSNLTPDEIKTVRNFYRYRGYPWAHGADHFLAVYQKIEAAARPSLSHLTVGP